MMKEDEQEKVRATLLARIDREEDLLNQRLNIFLIVNGLAGVAIGVEGTRALGKAAIAFVTVIVNILWVICSTHTLKTRRRLGDRLQSLSPSDPVTSAAVDALGNQHRLRPPLILGIYLPLVLCVSWLTATIANLRHVRSAVLHNMPY